MWKKHIIIFIMMSFFFLSLSLLYAAPKVSIRVNGKWTLKLDDSDLTGGAGSDFPSTWESVSDLIDVDVSKASQYWEVTISKADSPWPSQVQVWARRTTDGTGTPATITGGSSYQQVTNLDEPFFSGTGDISAIKIQLKLEGVTVGVNLDDFLTTISYTVTDGYSDWP